MSLKQIIQNSLILKKNIDKPFEIPGEPMIYSLKYPVGLRTRGLQYFRNMQWKSILKSNFRSFYRTNIPLVLIVRLYVTPTPNIDVPAKVLSQESMPAVMSYELCDYGLSLLEMLHHVLFNSYRQIVKLDIEKFYSARPRTEMKFMKWDEYVKLQSSDTSSAETESVSQDEPRKVLQSKRKRHGTISESRQEIHPKQTDAALKGTATGDSTLCVQSTTSTSRKKAQRAKPDTAHEAP